MEKLRKKPHPESLTRNDSNKIKGLSSPPRKRGSRATELADQRFAAADWQTAARLPLGSRFRAGLSGETEPVEAATWATTADTPLAGLDPAIHVFFDLEVGSGKDVDARDKPGQGEFPVGSRRTGASTARFDFPRTALPHKRESG